MKIEEFLDKIVADRETPGANILALKDGKEVIYHQAGYRDVANKKPFDRDTIIRLYSQSKPVTAAAAMLLMERGEMALGAPVSHFIPEYANMQVWENGRKVAAKRPIYVKDLLCMTSGLVYGMRDPGVPACLEAQDAFDELQGNLNNEDSYDTVGFAKRLAKGGLIFQPGSGWNYGTSADVLGAVIEIVSGMKFSEFLHKEFFEPLGMKDTGFYAPIEKHDRLALTYEFYDENKGWEELGFNHLGIERHGAKPPKFESGGAGLYSTLDDYAKFATMLINMGAGPDGKQILSEGTVKFFTGGGLTREQMEYLWCHWDSLQGFNYGNLMRVGYHNGMGQFPLWVGEYGWDGWLGTNFINAPEEKITILMGTQIRDAGAFDFTQRFRNVLYADERLK